MYASMLELYHLYFKWPLVGLKDSIPDLGETILQVHIRPDLYIIRGEHDGKAFGLEFYKQAV